MSAVAAVGKRGRKKDLLKKFFFSSPRNRRRRSVRRERERTRWFILPPRKSGEWQNFLKEGEEEKGIRVA